MLKTIITIGTSIILAAMGLVAAVMLYQIWRDNPSQAAGAGVVVAGVILLSVLRGRK